MMRRSNSAVRAWRRALPLCLLPALLILLGAAGAQAEPIDLDADNAEIDNARGVSVYTGNVVLTRGPRRITGDRMTVHLREDDAGDQALDHVVVEGEPAVYNQRGGEDRRPIEAEAPRMEYYASGPERVILLEGARLTQGRNTFTGERIEYEVAADRVHARGEPETGRRVQIRLFPDDEDNGDDE
ncbi:lipopolysaccharide export system protein LptA [Aquisalimonas asiatica]|uniref:Lipopolysaccharide export system protein LptA n=1 Tax=Aquisalimonas asiatica TaxID=406100 RepID=A0A1H8S9Z7_9GAMM|nr:lipopolysaccharide export system protein LptA [Aquisalimonas asiatica]